MKIILHIGMPKAGSTAIQRTCFRERRLLATHGVLFPRGHPPNHRQHNFLAALTASEAAIPRALRAKYGPDAGEIRAAFAQYWQEIDRQIRSTDPEYVVLSGEGVFTDPSEEGVALLNELLRPYTDEITVLAYVRSPSTFFLSATQQRIKASHTLRPIGPILYRRTLEKFEAGIAKEMVVVAYDRQSFLQGDIFQDFVRRTMPDKASSFAQISSLEESSTLSAEAMSILLEYRKKFHSDRRNLFTDDTKRLIVALVEAEGVVGGHSRPRLRSETRDLIDGMSSDLQWLRDHYGVIFADVDYATAGKAPARKITPRSIADICHLDEERHRDLRSRVSQFTSGPTESPTVFYPL